MKSVKFISLSIAVLALCGCSDRNKRESDDKTQTLEREVAELNALVGDLDRRMQALSNEVWITSEFRVKPNASLLNEVFKEVTKLRIEMDSAHRAEVRLSSTFKGFERIDTDTGSFFIVFEDAQPYLDGYKVRLRIGNPSLATYHGFKLRVKWGGAEPKLPAPDFNLPERDRYDELAKKNTEWEKSHANWEKSLRTQEVEFPNFLKPGMWSRVEAVLSPAKSDELAYFVVTMETQSLSLLPPPSD